MRRSFVAIASLVVLVASIAIFEFGGLMSHRFVEGLLVLASLVGLAWAARGKWRDGLLIACSLVFGLTAIEGATLLFAPKSFFARNRAAFHDEGLVAKRDLVGWGPTRPGVFHLVKIGHDGEIIYDTHATIDAHLNRQTLPSSGPHAIVFVGDSFIFGDGIPDKATLPQAFADLNGGKIPVLNLAFSGWAPSQNLAALQSGLYKGLLVQPARFILFSAAFHIERTACKGDFALGSAPHYVLDEGGLTNAGTCRQTLPGYFPALTRFAMRLMPGYRDHKVTSRDVETYLAIIETFAATVKRDYGAETTVLYEPYVGNDLDGTGYTLDRVVEALRTAGLDVLVKHQPDDADEDLYAIKGDGHPTALANRETAQLLEDHLRRVAPQVLAPPVAMSKSP